ncbi:transketolase C-terminal domain-containing protein [Sulfuricurvum sp. RIFCSPLOWO2_12_FULL_43_24]|uniref:transketolase family protein n=1 Tax=Sulfuricurvum sp. RIFCSPLOWO2_12_FULL_43_24 TaxID=1802247 RepID=UPI0008D601E2|nr:transketolase C-terminal domain-containing protein [Sulfuricurvum sp. RIFCSPLOWO2_12_FULL_43_24]OHD90000.1 MAG: transketolase [Sulfuricurvum sp. RIFCSPLOWO2_12_FULL_43_24]OHD92772.1 MAG: transketolase [Sulfuricurvum sp. RIFCSPLOWO2_12_43_5]
MQEIKPRAMRDVFIESLRVKMAEDELIFFLSADFGSPALDKLRELYPNRFLNVGIAEQNLINVATGLALEGFKVYAYAIAPFITMRCYEQIRVNLAVLSQIRPMCVNIIGVGAGFSYDMSGPTHHCLEDLSIMGTLPNVTVFSPSDYSSAERYVDETLKIGIRYLRFDAKPLHNIDAEEINVINGFRVVKEGSGSVILSTGFMTHKAVEYANALKTLDENIGVIDLFLPSNFNYDALEKVLDNYDTLISLEEGIGKAGGLDSKILHFLNSRKLIKSFTPLAMQGAYSFEIGSRDSLHEHFEMGLQNVIRVLKGHNG